MFIFRAMHKFSESSDVYEKGQRHLSVLVVVIVGSSAAGNMGKESESSGENEAER